MGTAPAKTPPEPAAAPLNFIYACSICCASFADVYESHNQTVEGLSDGINPKERLVTRLFLASCCHVFCGKHLEGGGPNFHPSGQRPSAPCPVCVKEKEDSALRDLYSIRGFNKDEYDPLIPTAWFTAPPIKLDGNGKEMEALRFQYIALIRYCQNTHATRRPLQKALAEAEKKLTSAQDSASEEQAKLLQLQQEIKRLRLKRDRFDALKAEVQRLQSLKQEVEQYRRLEVNPRDLETFTANKTAIRHYLKLVPMLLDQNDKMKTRLAQLGFAMALEPVPNFKGLDPNAFDCDDFPNDYTGDPGARVRTSASSHTAGRSAHTSGHTSGRVPTARSSPFAQRPMKRQRVNSPMPVNMDVDQPSSRDAMPPPPKPISRMRSMRRMFPTFRKKFSHGRTTVSPDPVPCHNNDDSQIHNKDDWQDSHNDRSVIHEGSHSNAPYMTGALPIEEASQSSASQLPSSMGNKESTSTFTFRAHSPIKMNRPINGHRPVQLPTEPSYIRLMDGLSSDTGVELGLRDPRESPTKAHDPHNWDRQVLSPYQTWHGSQERRHQVLRETGSSLLRQSPSGPSSSANRDLAPYSYSQTDGYIHRTHMPNSSSITRAPRRYQQPGPPQFESVVSSFFESSHHQAPVHSKVGLAEPPDSSSRSGASQSQNYRMKAPLAGCREPRSLNGLSFFDSPVNSRNEVIQHGQNRRMIKPALSPRYYQGRNLDSRGFMTRPETEQPAYVGDGAYVSSKNRPSYSRHGTIHSQSVVPFTPFQRSSYSRTEQLPLTMPLIPSSRPPTRSQPQWKSLQRAGVRSSRQMSNNFSRDRFDNSATHSTSRSGHAQLGR